MKNTHKPPAYLSIGIGLILILIASLSGCKKPEPIYTINGIEIDNLILVPDYNDPGLQAFIASRSNEPMTLWSLKPQNNVIGTSPVSSSIITKQRILRPLLSGIIDGNVNGTPITPFTDGSDFSTWTFGEPLPPEWMNNYRTYTDSTMFGTLLQEMQAVGKIIQTVLGVQETQLYVTVVTTSNPFSSDFRLINKYGFILANEALLSGTIRFRTIENRQYTPAPASITGGCTPDYEYIHNWNAVPNLVRICNFEDYGLSVEFWFESGL
jgi:hypothetical protein